MLLARVLPLLFYVHLNYMETRDKIAFKSKLKEFCRHTIEQRIAAASKMIQHAQEGANSEQKSSAGDKYETGRAMGHLQKDMHTRQLTGYIKELSDLHAVNTGMVYTVACAGAFVETDIALFFIAAGLGKQTAEGKSILFLSPHASLAGIMQNKTSGDSFHFNNSTAIITEIW